ncbi:hypothetical protein [Candidatus Nitrospira bockiana]
MKLLLCNVGWSDNYSGSFLKGDHEFIRKHKGDGSERWNFKRFLDSKAYGYIRGMGKEHSPPQLPTRLQRGWTVLFYAKDPRDSVLKFVGFYKQATILSDWRKHPINQMIRGRREKHVLNDVMALTKLNYNACIFADGEPVTLKFAYSVGEILTAGPLANIPPLQFKYYI